MSDSNKKFDDWWDAFVDWGYRSEVCIASLESVCQPYNHKTFESEMRYWLKAAFEAGQTVK